jgi:hypothetical protein
MAVRWLATTWTWDIILSMKASSKLLPVMGFSVGILTYLL